MTVEIVNDLLAASSALLSAEELLLRAGCEESALAYNLAATVMRLTRDAIGQALALPENAGQRVNLFLAARELDGAGSPLMFRAAAALAEA